LRWPQVQQKQKKCKKRKRKQDGKKENPEKILGMSTCGGRKSKKIETFSQKLIVTFSQSLVMGEHYSLGAMFLGS